MRTATPAVMGRFTDAACPQAALGNPPKRRNFTMLILCRRRGETIYINDDIQITITKVDGNQAWVGINAPSSVEDHREEIYRRIQAEKRSLPCE